MGSYDAWKASEPDYSRDPRGAQWTGQRRHDANCEALRAAITRNLTVARWWAIHAMRSARSLGLYPPTEVLQRECDRAA